MVRRDVEHRGRDRRQAVRRFHLEARDLEHVRVRFAAQEIQRGRPKVAACRRPQPLRRKDLRCQRRHRALAVAARHRDHRCTRSEREQLDVADDGEPAAARLHGERQVVRQPRRKQHAARPVEPARVERLERHVDPGQCRAQLREPRRIGAAVDDAHAFAACRQIARNCGPRSAEADDETVFRRGVSHRRFLSLRLYAFPPPTRTLERERGCKHQRIFKLAKPMSTKITVMIQKRTITLGSAQPLSSK